MWCLLVWVLILTPDCQACHNPRGFVVGYCTLVESSKSPSHSQGVGVLCSHWVIQHCHPSWHWLRVPCPSDSGSRSTSGDTGEGELRDLSIELRVQNEAHTIRYWHISCKVFECLPQGSSELNLHTYPDWIWCKSHFTRQGGWECNNWHSVGNITG